MIVVIVRQQAAPAVLLVETVADDVSEGAHIWRTKKIPIVYN